MSLRISSCALSCMFALPVSSAATGCAASHVAHTCRTASQGCNHPAQHPGHPARVLSDVPPQLQHLPGPTPRPRGPSATQPRRDLPPSTPLRRDPAPSSQPGPSPAPHAHPACRYPGLQWRASRFTVRFLPQGRPRGKPQQQQLSKWQGHQPDALRTGHVCAQRVHSAWRRPRSAGRHAGLGRRQHPDQREP
jgi:hypothetical protein